MKGIRVLFLFILLISHFAEAQIKNLKFQRISTQEGLSQSNVICMLQDKKGFLWMGTRDGLNKYDGYGFTVYKSDLKDPNSLSNNFIRSIVEDDEGNIWIATWGGGLNKFDPQKETFTSFKNNPEDTTTIASDYLNVVYKDSKNHIWVGTYLGGLNLLDPKTNTFSKICKKQTGLNDNNVLEIFEDSKKNFWIGTENGGLNLYDRDLRTFKHFRNDPEDSSSLSLNNVRKVFEDSKGNIWIGTYGGGLNKFNENTQTFSRFQKEDNRNSISHNVIFSLGEDDDGNLWIGTENGGLNIYNPITGEFIVHEHNLSDISTISNNSIYSLYKDSTGNMWVGTFSGGVSFFNRDNNKFIYFRSSSSPNSLNNNNVLCFYEDSDNNIWVGTDGGGVNVLDVETGKFSYFVHNPVNENSISGNYVLTVIEDSEKNIWMGTWGSGLSVLDKKNNKFTRFKNETDQEGSISNDNIWFIYEDNDQDIWVGTYFGGLNRYDKKTKTFKHYQNDPDDPFSLSNNNVYTMLQDSRGILWIGTDGGGLNAFDKRTEKFTHYKNQSSNTGISNNVVNGIFEDQKENLWVSSNSGLNYFDYKAQEFTRYYMEDGLPDNLVFGILEDKNKHLWLSTNKGLSKFDPKKMQFKNYTVADGLQHNEFKQQAYYKCRSGKMYFGGINGFNVFDPDNVREYDFDPPLVFTGFQLFNKSVPISSGYAKEEGALLSKHISYTDELVLTYDQSVISLDFASLNFCIPEKKKYQYKLEGFDDDWNDIGQKRSLTYTNLNPGEYKLLVKGLNNNGDWSENIAQLGLIITPPFWKTWWFYLLSVSFLIGSVFLFVQVRLQVTTRQKKLLEQQVKERTSELQELNEELIVQANEINHQREEIKTLYDDVKDSIMAAQVIQQSILPNPVFVKKHLPDSFIMNKPKDMVSGDFYWFDVKDGRIIVAVVDCTGHGVSGAFMSINGHHLLNQAIHPFDDIIASEVLDRLNLGILKELNHQEEHPVIKDGMDIALCVLDKEAQTAQFAGANNPLYILRKNKLIQIKGNRFSIGMSFSDKPRKFTNHKIGLLKGDIIYMFSDGYADQIGGERSQKYMYPRFRELLLNISGLHMDKQLQALEENLANWKGEEEQLDDILVMGFRI